MKHGFEEEVMAADTAAPAAQPNVQHTMTHEKKLKTVEDPMDFYNHGWFSQVRPLYRRIKVDPHELDRYLNIDFTGMSLTHLQATVMSCMVCSSFMKVSVFYEHEQALFDKIVAKACNAAELYPEAFAEALQACYPWIFDANRFPNFEEEKQFHKMATPVMRCNDGPVNYYVWIHTIRLLHDKEPLKRLNIDFAIIEEVESCLKSYDLIEYYRFLHIEDPEKWPPYYIIDFWREQGIEVDFVPSWK